MALEIDGAKVLGAIVGNPELFTDLRSDLAKAARKLVIRQLKAKDTTVDALRAVRASIGKDAFALIVDGLTEANVRALAAKFDGGHADLADEATDWRRHILALADGTNSPAPRPVARRSLSTATQPPIGSLRHESVQARPKRKSKH